MESHGYVSHPHKKTPQRLIQGATAGTIRTVGFQQDPRDPTSGKPGQKPQTVGRGCNQGVLGHFLPGKREENWTVHDATVENDQKLPTRLVLLEILHFFR
jgi:hypothetical protein